MSQLTISTVQTSLFWEDKSANLAMLGEKIQGIHEHTEVVVLPEMFTTGFSMEPARLAETMDGGTMQWMKDLARNKRIILTGSLIIEEGGDYFNRLVWVLPNGQVGYYDKRHLFAYGGEDKCYKAGNKRVVASVKGWRILLLICYDLRFPVWARQSSASEGPEYDLIINVANWPERRIHAWRTLLAARAIENQSYVVGVNRIGLDGKGIAHVGDTLVLDPMGLPLYHGADREEVHTITLNKQPLDETRQQLPFLKDADGFTILNG
jgi:omega-amidase